jgi:hypothetical protein
MNLDAKKAAAFVAAIVLAVVATVTFYLNPQVPLGVPWDEPGKVSQILRNDNNFYHPILMLQIVRLANLWFAATDPVRVLDLGRTMAAASGGLLVFATIVLARRVMEDSAALGAGVLTAVAPLTVLHSQLFKEDIFVAPWLILGLLALDDLRRYLTVRSAVLFGIAAGLAASAKYNGIILVPLCLLVPIWVKVPVYTYYRTATLALSIAAATFCIVNFPLFLTPEIFISSLNLEIRHALKQHYIRHDGVYSNFAFTWNANLLPGLCAPLALAGIVGASIVVVRWRANPPILRTLLVFGLAWYLVHELSPAKPFPEGARHMTVMAAVFAVFAVVGARFIGCWLSPSRSLLMTAAMVGGLAVAPAMRSFELVRSAPSDTRLVVERLVQDFEGPIAWFREDFEDRGYGLRLGNSQPLKVIEEGANFLVVNELLAQRYIFSLTLPNQDQFTRHVAANYEALLRRPALLVTSKVGYFAFRNLPLRIIPLRGDTRELEIAAMRSRSLPDVELRISRVGL